jgi:hypothetical protein
MFMFLWTCITYMQICVAFLIHPPIDSSNLRWVVVRHNNIDDDNDDRQSLVYDYPRRRVPTTFLHLSKHSYDGDDPIEKDTDIEDWESLSAELLLEDEDEWFDEDWLSDKEKARLLQLERQRGTAGRPESHDPTIKSTAETKAELPKQQHQRPSPYTEDEEEIIAAMGGKSKQQRRRREPGFLGDSTLMEICTDYSVPISYLADVLCIWGVPVPIHIHDRLGDLVTGEQAFAIVEAVNTLDVAALHDRYSNTNIQQLCYEWDMDIQQAFEMAMKEGWSLPFGVQTCLRVEQERELLRVLGSEAGLVDLPDDDEYDDGYY